MHKILGKTSDFSAGLFITKFHESQAAGAEPNANGLRGSGTAPACGALPDRLHDIQRDTPASPITEVVKNALQLYAAAVDGHKNGGAICFKDAKG
jgi:hypothetical protein